MAACFLSADFSLLELRGGEELLFRFGEEEDDGTAWHHGKHVGTVSVLQQWIAFKKLARDNYDVSKVSQSTFWWPDLQHDQEQDFTSCIWVRALVQHHSTLPNSMQDTLTFSLKSCVLNTGQS
jgi:hypothetical protein